MARRTHDSGRTRRLGPERDGRPVHATRHARLDARHRPRWFKTTPPFRAANDSGQDPCRRHAHGSDARFVQVDGTLVEYNRILSEVHPPDAGVGEPDSIPDEAGPTERSASNSAGEFYAVASVQSTLGTASGGFAATASRMRRTTSSSVGYGDFSAGRSGSGISSMR